MDDYGIYLRKSRADRDAEQRGEGETLARHKRLLLELAGQLKLNITRIYEEIVSGETISARPEVQKLLSDVENGLCAGVLVMEIERLARGDTIDQGILFRTFKYSHTKIITPVKTYDPDNPYDEEYFEFGLFMSRREYKTINRRIQQGRIASIQEGKYISSIAPYGYDRVKLYSEKGYTLQPNAHADVIRLIFSLYTKGLPDENGTRQILGMSRIASQLDSLHIKPMKRDSWSKAAIADVLKNPVYTGKLCWQKRKEVRQIINGHLVKTRPEAEQYIISQGLHEPIIDDETFRLAQAIRKNKLHTSLSSGRPLKNPLSGILYCKRCGRLMTRLAPGPKMPLAVLKCPDHNCRNVSAPLYLIEEKLLSALRLWLKDYRPVPCPDKDKEWDSSLNVLKKAAAYSESELKTLTEQLDRTHSLLEQGIYTPQLFAERYEKLSGLIALRKKDLDQIQKKYAYLQKPRPDKGMAKPSPINLSDIYYTLPSVSDQNIFLKLLLERVEYNKIKPNKKGSSGNAGFSLSLYPKLPSFSLNSRDAQQPP